MRYSDRLKLDVARLRKDANAAIKAINESETPSDEQHSAMKETSAELERAETRYSEAVESETRVDSSIRSEQRSLEESKPEDRELSALGNSVSIARFLGETATGRELDGPEAEYRSELLGRDARPGLMPVELLQVREAGEVRADASTTVASTAISDGSRASVLERIFKHTIAAQLGVAMPSVPVGDAVYPIMTGGASGATVAAGDAKDAEAATFTGETLSPRRVSARYIFRLEDAARFPGLESVLRTDLGRALGDQVDDQVISGDGAAPNVNGFLSELPDPVNPAAIVTWDTWLKSYTDKVDGINAMNLGDLRAVVGTKTYQKVVGLFPGAAMVTHPQESSYEYVRARMSELMVSARIAAPVGNIQKGIVALSRYPGQNAVAPVWPTVELIRDPYSSAAKGEVAITAVMLFNFKVLREDAWSLVEHKLA